MKTLAAVGTRVVVPVSATVPPPSGPEVTAIGRCPPTTGCSPLGWRIAAGASAAGAEDQSPAGHGDAAAEVFAPKLQRCRRLK